MKHVIFLTQEGAVTLKFTPKLKVINMFYVSHRNVKQRLKRGPLAGYSFILSIYELHVLYE